MKTLLMLSIAVAASVSVALAEGPVDTAKNVGNSVVKGTKKAVNTVVDAVTPDPDAHHANVTLTDDHIAMPNRLKSGKTAFIVMNSGKENHNFEVRGNGTDQKFLLDITPKSTKVLHVHLTSGAYTAMCPQHGHKHKAIETSFTVR